MAREIRITDKEYPQKLKGYSWSPEVLYCLGDVSLLNKTAAAIVGTRYPSNYAESYALGLSAYLAFKKIVVISGLALGIDTKSHIGPIIPEGKTIAVLGSTLENIYPKENKWLAEKILQEGGLLVTQYNTDEYNPGRFPERDYLMALLSEAVIPLQMSKHRKANGKISYGGTQHAIDAALKYHRLLIVPQPDPVDAMKYPDKYEGIYKAMRFANHIIEHDSNNDFDEVARIIHVRAKEKK